MASVVWKLDPSREMLSQTIVDSLKSWPEFQRRIFVDTHYRGRSIDDVAGSLGLQRVEVIEILQHCERKLHRALKAFREENHPEVSVEPPRALNFKGCPCIT